MKTLKREEIYANDYVDLEHLRRNIEAFIDDLRKQSLRNLRSVIKSPAYMKPAAHFIIP